MRKYINLHTHSDTSNIRLLDSTNSIDKLLTTAHKMNYHGLALTEHESVSSHIKIIQKVREMKKKKKLDPSFKLILGNEIYLCDTLEEVKDNYKSGVTKFPHFVLLATDKIGHEQLRIMSSRAWSRSFYTSMMERTPTLKSDIEEIVKSNQGHIIASSACLGSEVNIHLLAIKEANESNDLTKANLHRNKLNEFILWCIDIFGQSHFFIELQPALSEEQIHCNKELIKIANHYNLKMIVTTDAHYPRPEDRPIHEAFLNAKDAEREVASFYEACYLMSVEEIYERMDYINTHIIDEAIDNTMLIGDMCEDYTIEHETVIPRIELPEFELRHVFKPAYDKYEYIKKMAYSDNKQDQYTIKLIEDGFYEKLYSTSLSSERFHQILSRIDVELGEIWEISQELNQAMSAYYITVKQIIDIIWTDAGSIVGSGRGSSSGFILCYILGITQINPLDYEIEMPHWRHLHKSRPDVGALDIDIDTESSKRPKIIQALKEHFGEDKVLQVATFGTETSKAAITTACRGLGYDSDIALHLGSMIPFERGKNWTIQDCLYGNEKENRKPVKEFINEINKYPKLRETSEGLNGLISRRGIHAGGVILFNEIYYKSNSIMKAPNGNLITAFSLDDCQAIGNVKFDLLTVEATDKIRTTLDLLIENNEIEEQETLRKTFDKYLHPDVIDKVSKEVYDVLSSDTVADVFQFGTDLARDAIKKVQPSNLIETASLNSLMRLQSDKGEQPIDTFVRFKNDINEWYKEMRLYGLNEEEIKIMEEHLLIVLGIADTQEIVMKMSMDDRIAGFDVAEANKLRKVIAKSKKEEVADIKELFMSKGIKLGNSKNILNYVWDVQISRQLLYSFSSLHVVPYTLMAIQEINLNLQYNPIYWQTACLTVNSGSMESDDDAKKQNSNYGKVASAIGELTSRNVTITPPSINKAGYSFTPDIENNAIIYGLRGMVGIGDVIVDTIIEHRPYNSFKDFYERLYKTKLITNSQMVQLIKAGCFDEFDKPTSIMNEYVNLTFSPNKKLTTANLKNLISMNLIPEKYSLYIRYYKFKEHIYSRSIGKSDDRKTKNRLFLLDNVSTEFLIEHFSEDSIVDYHNGQPVILEALFDKEYDKKMEVIKEWLKKESVLESYNNVLRKQAWIETTKTDNTSKWQMQSLSYYYGEHELANIDKDKYGVQDFYSLPEEPVVTKEYEWGGRKRKEFDISRIAGTVLDKDKNKHTVTILTTDGVVTCKFYGNQYSALDRQLSSRDSNGKKTVIEGSWFKRGTLLILTGYRRGNQFVPKRYKDSVYNSTIALIEDIDEQGNLQLKTERTEI